MNTPVTLDKFADMHQSFTSTVRSVISAPLLQNAVSHTTAERNGTAVVASVLRWCDSWHFAAVARL
jgi:hypothetical protein